MATEKRLMSIGDFKRNLCHYCNTYMSDEPCEPGECWVYDVIAQTGSVDAVPVDEIKFLYMAIDENGIPELKIQLGDKILCLRRENDPVNVREVVHGQWIPVKNKKYGYYMGLLCSECGHKERNKGGNYCPNCGADMRERKDNV